MNDLNQSNKGLDITTDGELPIAKLFHHKKTNTFSEKNSFFKVSAVSILHAIELKI